MKFFLSTLFILSTSFAFAQESEYLDFDVRKIELGAIKKGEVIDTVFTFKNISKEPIQIDIVDACECTELDWSEESIAPGEEGKIYVSFDSGKKDVVEEISVDITLMNIDPKTGGPVLDGVSYTYSFK